MNNGVSEEAAEAFARMLPLVVGYRYPVTASRISEYIERPVSKVTGWFEELEKKGYLCRISGKWQIKEGILDEI